MSLEPGLWTLVKNTNQNRSFSNQEFNIYPPIRSIAKFIETLTDLFVSKLRKRGFDPRPGHQGQNNILCHLQRTRTWAGRCRWDQKDAHI